MDIVDRLITRVEMQGASGFIRQTTAMGGSLKSMAAMLAIGAGASLAIDIVKTQIETEKLNRQMTALFRGPNGAAQGFSLASRFATRFHRDVHDVEAAMLAVSVKGVTPTMEVLREAAILSDRSGKDMTETADAVARAWLGNRDALREYGLTFNQLVHSQTGAVGGLAGQINALKNAWTDMQREAGRGGAASPVGFAAGAGARGVGFLTHMLQGLRMAGLRLKEHRIEGVIRALDFQQGHHSPELDRELAAIRKHYREEDDALNGRAPAGDPRLRSGATGMAGLIREFVGSGKEIGPIGIKPSELPNMNLRYGQAPIRVQVDGRPIERAVKAEFNAMLEQLNRHRVPVGANH